MKKTEKYQLNQWEISDRIRMEDFNADNARLEAILEGKTGRFQKIIQHSPGNGENAAGPAFSIKDWSDWECIIGTFDLHKTNFLPDDYLSIYLQYRDDTHSGELFKLTGGSFVMVLFPFHDQTANIRGFFAGGSSAGIFVDQPFQNFLCLSVYLKNTKSTHFMKYSDTKYTDPVWTMYGLK